jgi:NAD(P)-dependent dehydrogenase (short-subunit alcohol dehydrogenase family)
LQFHRNQAKPEHVTKRLPTQSSLRLGVMLPNNPCHARMLEWSLFRIFAWMRTARLHVSLRGKNRTCHAHLPTRPHPSHFCDWASALGRQVMGRLTGKVAIVTGGGGDGIGQGISRVLAREGAHVSIMEIDIAAAEAVQERIVAAGGEASVVRCDVSSSEEVRSAFEQVVREHGRIDTLVTNAGIGLIRPVAEASEEEFDRLASIDLRGLWLCCKYAIPHMQRQRRGAIINIASVHARATMPLYGIYAGMKAGVVGLTRGIAVQYGPDGIRANALCPGLVDGKQTREVVAQFAPNVENWLEDFAYRHQALPHLIQPEDIGHVVAFLASEEAGAITGAEIPADAGLWAQLVSRD